MDVCIGLKAEHPPVPPVGMPYRRDPALVQGVRDQDLVLTCYTPKATVQAHVDAGKVQVVRKGA